MAQVIWSPRACADLEALIAYIARDAPLTARRFAQKILHRAASLKWNPLGGGYIAEDDAHTYREILQGNYRIIYRASEQVVCVVAVHHAARLLDVHTLD